MVKSCCAVGCTNRKTKGSTLSFYRFPTADNDRRSPSAERIGARLNICSTHFISGQKSNDPLSPDYVPSIFEHISTLSRIKRRNNFKAYRRRKNVFKRRLENTMKEGARKKAAKKLIEVAKEEQTAKEEGQVLGTSEAGVQTQLSLEDIAYLEEKSCDVKIVHDTILTQDFLQSDGPKAAAAVKFYTGLPSYARLMAVFSFVSAHLKELAL